ncbi:MAG TPA: TonB-dependent receptor, partial [Variovorax sp.]
MTATRVATPIQDVVSDTVVIDRAQIEQQASRTLPEILARLAGVQISANGGLGQSSSVFIRGADANGVILMIDGVRYGSATLGTPVWDNIPVEMIDRIEVVKGPASALYGSDGVGGVVQIFTRKANADDPVFSPRVTTTLGSDSYRQLGAGFSGASGAATYSLDLTRTTVNSFSATNPNAQFGVFNPDRDPFDQTAVNASFGYQLNSAWKLSAGLLNSEGLVHYDDGPQFDTRATVRTEVGYLGATGQITSDWTTQLRYSHSEDYFRNIVAQPYNLPGLFETSENQYLWQNDIATRIGTVVAGLELREQDVKSDTQYTVTQRDIDSAFLGLNGSSGAQSWQLNTRHDSNSQFGDDNTWFAGYAYRLTPNWRVNVSQGTSFTAPSFNQLYYPGFGNPLLRPQNGKNTDAGVTWSQDGQSVKLVAYNNKIDNFITNTTLPQNLPYARITGETLSYDGQFAKLGLHASYDWLDPRNEATGQLLPRRSRDQATLSADYTQGPWRYGGSALYVGRRFDDPANTLVLDPYTTIDLHV